MCFSAEASFGAGAVLCTIGIATIRKTQKPSQLAFAAIPLFFGIQQLSEGFVWLSLTKTGFAKYQSIATHTFSFFSHVLWPVWVSFAVLLFERIKRRKTFLFPIFLAGLILSLLEVYFMATRGMNARVDGHHIEYYHSFPSLFVTISEIVYGVTTILPCFIASYKKLRLFAIALIGSIIIANIFYHQWLISVWCFFAALLSCIIYHIIKHIPQTSRSRTV
jgi:hypothetical protein